MIIALKGPFGGGVALPFRPVIRLAAGTLMTRMQDVHGARVFQDLEDLAVEVVVAHLEHAGSGLGLSNDGKVGRVAHRKAERILTTSVDYDEMGILDEVMTAGPAGRTVPVAADFLAVFAERIEVAVAALVTSCDRKGLWSDRALFLARWDDTLDALKRGVFARPYEFTTRPAVRKALDATWPLVAKAPLDIEEYEALASAYLLLRDAGWNDAQYGADPRVKPGKRGLPARIVNCAANVASSPPPDDTYGYTLV